MLFCRKKGWETTEVEGKESETSDKESNLPYVNGDENTEIVEMQGTENNEQFNNTDIIQKIGNNAFSGCTGLKKQFYNSR